MNYAEELRRKKLSMASIDPWEESSRLSKSNIRLLAQNERLVAALRQLLRRNVISLYDYEGRSMAPDFIAVVTEEFNKCRALLAEIEASSKEHRS